MDISALIDDIERVVVRDVIPILQRNYIALKEELADRGGEINEGGLASWKSDGKGLVTRGEVEAEAALRTSLAELYPDISIIGEELEDSMSGGDITVVIDPVDGTSAMVMSAMDGSADVGFGLTVGVLKGRCAVAGVIYELLPDTRAGLKVGRICKAVHDLAIDERLLSARFRKPELLYCTAPDVMLDEGGLRFLGELSVQGCKIVTDYNCIGFMNVAQNIAHSAAFEADLSVHDVAALVPILQHVGCKVTDLQGKEIVFDDYERPYSIAAATAEIHDYIMKKTGGNDSLNIKAPKKAGSNSIKSSKFNVRKYR